MAILNVAFTSSSESESDYEDMELFLREENKYRRKPRVKNFIETVIYAYNTEEFKQHFR